MWKVCDVHEKVYLKFRFHVVFLNKIIRVVNLKHPNFWLVNSLFVNSLRVNSLLVNSLLVSSLLGNSLLFNSLLVTSLLRACALYS